MLSKENRLKKSSSFQRAHKHGNHVSGKYGKLIIFDRKDESPSRFGVAVSADKGNAVERNRAKRKVRHEFQELCNGFNGLDIFYIVWDVNFKFRDIKKEIERMLKNEIHNDGTN
jgi:ribonuclease P protein component